MTSRFAFAMVTVALVLAACSSSTDGRPSTSSTHVSAPGSSAPRQSPSGTGSASGSILVRADHLTTVVRTVGTGHGSVRIAAVATPGHFLPPSSLGLGCWLQPEGTAGHAGYVFLVDDLEATLSSWDATAGEYHEIVRSDAPGALHVHGANRLQAECRRTGKGASFRLTVNGNFVLGATYSEVTLDGDAVGVAVHGHRAEVQFDDFAVTGL